jgi:hypothetical protein
MVVDLGVQNDSQFGPREKLYVGWEIPGVIVSWRDRDGNECTGPALIGKDYTKSLAPKSTLRAHLEGWRGRSFTDDELRSFDVAAILGKPCQLSIVHVDRGDRTYANVAAVMGPPKGAAPKPSGKPIAFDVDASDEETFACASQLSAETHKRTDRHQRGAGTTPEQPQQHRCR